MLVVGEWLWCGGVEEKKMKMVERKEWLDFVEEGERKMMDRVAQISERLQHLKRDVKHLLDVVQEPLEKLKLIDSIQRLGVSYHFENEIETILRDIYENHYSKDNHEDDTLFNISLKFRLFRQQGYTVSCGVFEKLRNEKGEFNMSLIDDILGMLNLYEASHLAIHGEEILDQALDFTTFHLQSRLSDMRSDHKEKVTHALKWPLHKTMPRLTARYNIALHSNDGSRNELLLEFAALDFNILQVQHQEELSHLTNFSFNPRLVSSTCVPYDLGLYAFTVNMLA
ncbi:hypothetical protein RJT34_30241 [Clitoria ternatea]|uniref:Terpene synthase N-terminal domain-containing protein n=1 Tax=Clitoria ternatea TaxID=43366 RepID=A0AAN9EU80_CLITE